MLILLIYLSGPDNKDDTQLSNDRVSSAYFKREQAIEDVERRVSELQKRLKEMELLGAAQI